jgi:hypothetical protein
MSNPYQLPIAETRAEELTEALRANQPLQGTILTLRIIVASLAIGVVVFALYAIFANLGKPLGFGTTRDTLGLSMLGFGALQAALGLVFPPVIFRNMAAQPERLAPFAKHGPETVKILSVQQRITTATILGCAMFEGGAFANLVAFLLGNDLANLAAASVLLLGILAHFPVPGRCERKIAVELRRMKEDEALRPKVPA